MGSVGTTTEGDHKEYLRKGNFENLDEYDEEVLNDKLIKVPENEENVVRGRAVTDEYVTLLERTAKKIDEDSREGRAFRDTVQNAIYRTNDAGLINRLRKILDNL